MQSNSYHIFWNLKILTEKLTSEKKMKLIYTERLWMHKPYEYYYVIVHIDSLLNYKVISHDLYRKLNALKKFVNKIKGKLLNI